MARQMHFSLLEEKEKTANIEVFTAGKKGVENKKQGKGRKKK